MPQRGIRVQYTQHLDQEIARRCQVYYRAALDHPFS